MQWKNFLDSLSSLKASKAETQGAKKPYPTPTSILPAMLRANQRPNKAGNPKKIATLSGASHLFVLLKKEKTINFKLFRDTILNQIEMKV